MKSFFATATVCLLLAFPAVSAAQTRGRRTTQRRRAPAPATRLDETQVNAVRLQLAALNKDLTRFLYLYGRLSKDLELTAAQPESDEVLARTKAGLVENIRAVGDRLDKLEAQFRFTAGLERQYRTLEGVSRQAETAAQEVNANRFDQAGRTLLTVSTKLTDTLIEL
ncbi:MAG TPA: hypothetical protein VG148_18015 [Pyrinomonadaceae bacterium]|nr:hypothetical protein [Pyrinomonadaceae bacterium]